MGGEGDKISLDSTACPYKKRNEMEFLFNTVFFCVCVYVSLSLFISTQRQEGKGEKNMFVEINTSHVQ